MMHYLECIAMLEFLLKKLHNGQRTQVPVTAVDDVKQVMVQVDRKLKQESSAEIKARIRDVMEAVMEVEGMQGILVLTDTMKTALTSGIEELLASVQVLAFEHFKLNDFEPTAEVIPVMRGVVSTALSRGLI
ncbi:MAG: hypothetical protein NC548_11250 [Lachnospiraceae bacterium]|nr:hypothetical protein [Lachnospiraceae bacterium]MCM1235614.1 hypothetical protein [Ruminococcus flavefaciens]